VTPTARTVAVADADAIPLPAGNDRFVSFLRSPSAGLGWLNTPVGAYLSLSPPPWPSSCPSRSTAAR